jgi:hypothetical protein
MRHVIETGTDIAIVAFFDVAALPKDFDEQAKADQMAVLEKLSREGRLWYLETGADGGYLFHFYIETVLPELIAKHSAEPNITERFSVPSGEMWACGAEYVALDPKRALAKFSHMGASFQIPPGDYEITAWRTEWPEDFVEDKIKERIGNVAWRRNEALGQSTGCLFVALIIGTLVSLGVSTSRGTWGHFGLGGGWYWGGLGVLWVSCIAMMKSLKNMENHTPRKDVEREFPSIVVEMKRNVSSTKAA